jgi:hypothetical protein
MLSSAMDQLDISIRELASSLEFPTNTREDYRLVKLGCGGNKHGIEDGGPRSGHGVSVVALEGRIVLGEESNALREKLKSLIAEGKKKIVPNMDNTEYIDSSELGTLVAAHCSA